MAMFNAMSDAMNAHLAILATEAEKETVPYSDDVATCAVMLADLYKEIEPSKTSEIAAYNTLHYNTAADAIHYLLTVVDALVGVDGTVPTVSPIPATPTTPDPENTDPENTDPENP